MDREERPLIDAAADGDGPSFERLVAPHLGTLRGVVRRMVGHGGESDDLFQEALSRAFTGLRGFRGESSFRAWLLRIGVNACIDHLDRERRWRADAQIDAERECAESPPMRAEINAVLTDPEFAFDAHEHISACFTCVARSLPPKQEAALVLREILDLSNREAADTLGMTEPVLRNHLAAARQSMTEAFEGLCALVNKSGVCRQCTGFWKVTAENQRRRSGEALASHAADPAESFRVRLAIVRETPFDGGVSQPLHDLLFDRFRRMHAGAST